MTTNWHNANEYRDYPFVPQPATPYGISSSSSVADLALPHSLVVDAGVILGVDISYAPLSDYVYLTRISRDGNDVAFTLASTNTASQLVFRRALNAGFGEYSWERTQEVDGACPAKAWEGFLTTGDLSPLTELADGEAWEFLPGTWQLEPSRIQAATRGLCWPM